MESNKSVEATVSINKLILALRTLRILNQITLYLYRPPDESELLDKMPLVMRMAIAVDINLATFQKIALFQVGCCNPAVALYI